MKHHKHQTKKAQHPPSRALITALGSVSKARQSLGANGHPNSADSLALVVVCRRKARLAPAHMSPRAQRAEQRHAKNAATMLQTAWRGKSERMNRQKQAAAATKIQCRYRGNRIRANLPIPDDDDDDEEDDPAGSVPSAPLPPALRGRSGTGAVPTASVEEENVRELLLQVRLQTIMVWPGSCDHVVDGCCM